MRKDFNTANPRIKLLYNHNTKIFSAVTNNCVFPWQGQSRTMWSTQTEKLFTKSASPLQDRENLTELPEYCSDLQRRDIYSTNHTQIPLKISAVHLDRLLTPNQRNCSCTEPLFHLQNEKHVATWENQSDGENDSLKIDTISWTEIKCCGDWRVFVGWPGTDHRPDFPKGWWDFYICFGITEKNQLSDQEMFTILTRFVHQK